MGEKMPKSEWLPVSVATDRARAAIVSWFSPLCDGMVPIKAEVLVDIATDREKKFRVLMRDGEQTREVIRSKTKTGWTVTLKPRVTTQERDRS